MTGKALLIAAAAVAVLGFAFFFAPFGTNELVRTDVSPSGEWGYAIRFIDLEGATGSGSYEVETYPVADPAERRRVYSEDALPSVRWLDERTLEVDGQPVDVLREGDSVRSLRLSKALVVAVPALGLALAGTILLRRARCRRPAGPLVEGGPG